MKKRLECEQTDQVIFEGKVKQLEFDLEHSRKQCSGLMQANQQLSVANEEIKHSEREGTLKMELV